MIVQICSSTRRTATPVRNYYQLYKFLSPEMDTDDVRWTTLAG